MPIFAVCCQKFTNQPRNLPGYWTKVHQTFRRCRAIIGAIKSFICDIPIPFGMLMQQIKVFRRFCPKIGCHGIEKTRSDRSPTIKYLSFGKKIVKISPVHPEMIGLQEFIKNEKKEINARKIARLTSMPSGLNYNKTRMQGMAGSPLVCRWLG